MIPITFNKDDLNNPKKGNIRGQDLASYLSISMPKEAGILNIFTNPLSIISNVISTGYTTLTFNKGYVNIYGRCIYVEQGEQVQVPLPSSGTETGVFGIRVDLSQTGANEVKWFKKTTTLQQDNLLDNEVNGVYEFAIYNYTATASSFTLGDKIASVIKNILDADFITRAVDDNSQKVATTEFVTRACNNVKNIVYGTLSVTVSNTGVPENWVKRQVNFVIGHIHILDSNATRYVTTQMKIANIPEGFRPKTQINIVGVEDSWTMGYPVPLDAFIQTNGDVIIKARGSSSAIRSYAWDIEFAYEITN